MRNNNINSKIKNIHSIFRIIQRERNRSITRREIQAKTNLSWGTVSQYTNNLIESKVIIQCDSKPGDIGKPASSLKMNNLHYLIGINLHIEKVTGILVGLDGQIVNQRMIVVKSPDLILDYISIIIHDFLSNDCFNKTVLAIGISVAGNVDPKNGVLIHSVFSKLWDHIKIKDVLEAAFKLPVIVRRDCDCVITAERELGLISESHLGKVIEIVTNYGIGMSFLHENHLYVSAGNSQAEIGHLIVHPGGTLCNCGNRGCLEMYASKIGIVTQFRNCSDEDIKSIIDPQGSTDQIFNLIRIHAIEGNGTCQDLFNQFGILLGNVCASLASILDPDAIIIYGDMIGEKDLWKDTYEKQFAQNKFPFNNTHLLYSELDTSAPMLGAAFCALNAVLNDFLKQII